MNEQRELLWLSAPKDLGAEVGRPVPSRAPLAGWGSRGQKEVKEGPPPLPQLRALDPQVPWQKGSRNKGWVETPL